MNRRGFMGFSLAAVGGVFMGRRWYQQGRGLIVPETAVIYLPISGWKDTGWQRYEFSAEDIRRGQRGEVVAIFASPGPGKAIMTAGPHAMYPAGSGNSLYFRLVDSP